MATATEKLRYLVTANTKGFSGPIKAIAALATTAFVASVKVTADFEKELSKLRAISGANERQMGALEKKSRDLGKSTAYTAREVASLQTELAKLGFTTNEILNSSGGVLNLAAGLGVTLADAATLTGQTLRAFGIDAEDTGRVVDVLAKAASSSALDFTKLQESLKIAAPIAKAFNFTIEETTALLGTLANAGISGSIAGTALRQGFLELNKAGITLDEALTRINNSTDKAGTALDLVGKRASTAFLILAEGGDTTANLTKEFNKAHGAAEEMRKLMEDNLIGDFAKLKSAVTEMGIAVGQQTDGSLRNFTQWLTDVINGTDTTLGLLASLSRVFLFFEETVLLAFKAAEEFWILIQTIATANPFTGTGGIASADSLNRLTAIKKRLAEINAEIIDLSGGYGTGSSGGGGGTTSGGGGGTTSGGDNILGIGGGSSGGGILSGGFGGFTNSNPFTALAENAENSFGRIQVAMTNAEGSMASFVLSSNSTTEQLEIGWETVAGSIGAAVGAAAGGEQSFGQIAGSLLKSLGGALVSIGVAAVAAGKALAIFGIGVPSIAAGYYAIGIGAALIAGGSAIGKSASSSGGSSSSSASASSAAAPAPDVRSIQQGGGQGRNVGGLSTTDGDIIIPSDLLRQAMQASDRKYASVGG